MPRSLDTEIAYFNAHVDSLRVQADIEGKRVVLIHDRHPQGYYESVVDAATAGYQMFGTDPFLARQVDPAEHQAAIASIF